MGQERSLSDICYPPRTTCHHVLILPEPGPNVTFELRPHHTQMLSKFTGLKDAYLLLRELEEVCSMIHFPNISVDVVRMKLNSFYFERFC